jgi:hypothetical protein
MKYINMIRTKFIFIIHTFKKVILKLSNYLRKHLKLIFSLAVLFLFGSSIIYFALTAKPGDLFFSIKLFRENLYADSTSSEKINRSTKILEDRVNSYLTISKNSNCVKLVLAGEELKTQVKNSFNNLDSYSKKEIETYLSQTSSLFSPLESIEGACKRDATIEGFSIVFIDLAYKFDNESMNMDSQLKTSQSKLRKLKELLATNTPSNQETLDSIESLLTLYNDNLLKISEEENSSNITVLLETNDLIYKTTNTLFEETKVIYNREGSIYAICLLEESEQICSNESLNSLWNSIYDKSSPGIQISLGEEIYLEYLKLISL